MTDKVVPEGKYADIGDGLHMHYHDAGTGKPLVFLHGSGPGASGYSNFKGNYPYFAERGYRAIVVDNLGFGYSSKPDDAKYSMEYVTSGLTHLLEHLGIDQCSLVGNSHGGAVAITYALEHPDRVDKLVLMAPGGLEVTETYMEMRGIRKMMKVFMKGITREGMREVFGLQLYDPSQLEERTLDERVAIAELQPKNVLMTLRVPHMAPRLAELECPVFGWWGMNDQFCPATGATRIAESCPNARVMTLSKCGHWVMVEHRDLFNRLTLDFLDRG